MGDIHQPLHAGISDDKGGNQYQIQFEQKNTNLHAFWDNDLIAQSSLSNDLLVQQLLKINLHNNPRNTNFSNAAAESCAIVHSSNFYPNRSVERKYIELFLPVAKEQISIAGQRLANLLNQTLGN